MEETLNFVNIGVGLFVPILQDFLNKFVPDKFRLLCVFGLSLLLGVAYAVFMEKGIAGAMANSVIIFATAQTVYFKLIKTDVK